MRGMALSMSDAQVLTDKCAITVGKAAMVYFLGIVCGLSATSNESITDRCAKVHLIVDTVAGKR